MASRKGVARRRRAPATESSSLLPSAVEIERSILGAVLIQPSLSKIVTQRLPGEYFSLDWHQRIRECIGEFVSCDRPIRLESLVGELVKRGVLEKVGGAEYISGLVDGVVPDRETIEQYMEIVQHKWILRRLCVLVDSISSQARGPGVDALNLLSDSRRSLGELHTTAVQTTKTERLRGLRVDPASLVAELELFFGERAFLPEGASLLLALWTMNTWVFDAFDTTPYLLLESAVPQCGKTTVLQLLAALCREATLTSSATEAVLFRVIEAHHPTLLVDEAETLSVRKDRSEALLSIMNAGYKRGGKALRCDGESHEPKFFDTYSPKAMASIGGLHGALLDRCIVLTMRRRPSNVPLKPSRSQAIRRAAEPKGEL